MRSEAKIKVCILYYKVLLSVWIKFIVNWLWFFNRFFQEKLSSFILASQDDETGGMSDRPGDMVNVFVVVVVVLWLGYIVIMAGNCWEKYNMC